MIFPPGMRRTALAMIIPFAARPAAVSRTLVKIRAAGSGDSSTASISEAAMQNAKVNGPRPRWPIHGMFLQRQSAEQSKATPVRAAACHGFSVAARVIRVQASTAMPEETSGKRAFWKDSSRRECCESTRWTRTSTPAPTIQNSPSISPRQFSARMPE